MKQSNIVIALALALGVSSCTPKVGVLKSPDYKGNVGGKTPVENVESAKPADKDALDKKAGKARFIGKNISLVLPFQLNHISETTLADTDIKRSALALDYYQGFQLGLEELAKKGADFNLNVLDSRDNPEYSAGLALSTEVKEASLIIGPVYPNEIKAFSEQLADKETLQINPLAASMPSEFNIPNLVSLTPPIKAHSNAIAKRVAQNHLIGDVVIIYNTPDSDAKNFLNGMATAIEKNKSSIRVISVSSIAHLNDNLSLNGTNVIVTGTTDKFQIRTLLNNLANKSSEDAYSFQLFGHPLWDRYDFSMYSYFADFNPIITTESNLKPWTNSVKAFKENYEDKYGVTASDQSYKGYDSAIYFGGLIQKYGANNIKSKLIKDHYMGLYSSYKFVHSNTWGYANEAVSYRTYRSGSFQLQ